MLASVAGLWSLNGAVYGPAMSGRVRKGGSTGGESAPENKARKRRETGSAGLSKREIRNEESDDCGGRSGAAGAVGGVRPATGQGRHGGHRGQDERRVLGAQARTLDALYRAHQAALEAVGDPGQP